MRTTLTIDDDIANKLKKLTASQQKSFKEVVNNVLRRGLTISPSSGPTKKDRITLKSRKLKYRKGIDEKRLKELLDEQEIEM